MDEVAGVAGASEDFNDFTETVALNFRREKAILQKENDKITEDDDRLNGAMKKGPAKEPAKRLNLIYVRNFSPNFSDEIDDKKCSPRKADEVTTMILRDERLRKAVCRVPVVPVRDEHTVKLIGAGREFELIPEVRPKDFLAGGETETRVMVSGDET